MTRSRIGWLSVRASSLKRSRPASRTRPRGKAQRQCQRRGRTRRTADGEPLDFPDLILRLIAAGEVVRGFPYGGYWMDIGRHEDYAQAVEEFRRNRARLLPEGPNAKARRGRGAEGTGQA